MYAFSRNHMISVHFGNLSGIPDKLSGVMANQLDDKYITDKTVSEFTIHTQGSFYVDTSQNKEKVDFPKERSLYLMWRTKFIWPDRYRRLYFWGPFRVTNAV